jgi:hypothetical protein
VGSIPDEVTECFSYLIIPVTLGPEFYSVSNRNEYQRKEKKDFRGIERYKFTAIFVYVDDVRTSQAALVWAMTAC